MADEIPITNVSISTQEAAQISANQILFQQTLARAMIYPSSGLELYANAYQTWQLIKHITEKENKEIETELSSILESTLTLGDCLSNERITDYTSYSAFVKKILIVWDKIMKEKSLLGLGIKTIKK